MQKAHHIKSIKFDANKMYLIVDNQEYTFLLEKISGKLFRASENERAHYTVSPSGYGIHWPLLDEDLSIDGLLGIKHIPSQKNYSPKSLTL
ncbi:DUF2442 domain-containing protein [candidate division KSB1 bacterium]|nr:DUF2442 domain-containing protein [candidate division KSB1 bacterium]